MGVRNTLLKATRLGFAGASKRAYKELFYRRYPCTINVEVMTICNLKCNHCRVTYHGNLIPAVKPGFMDFSFFVEIVDKILPMIKRATKFQFSTVEPLFHKDVFRMMDYVSKHNKYISFPLHSNGMLLNEYNIRQICLRNIPSIAISLDGWKKETVERIKTGVDFDLVIRNIKTAKKIFGRKVHIETGFVATAININELVDYVDFCADLGVTSISVNGFLSFLPELKGLYLYSENGNDEVNKLFNLAGKRARKRGIFIRFPPLVAKPRGCNISSLLCIDEHGDVSPCIFLARKTPFELFSRTGFTSPLKFGNVLEDNPFSIWNKREFCNFRDQLKNASIPQECRFCPDAYGLICAT